MTLRTFWRINFDVVNEVQPDGTVEAKPRIAVEMTLWHLDSRTRVGRSVTLLEPNVEPPGSVVFADGVAHLNNGYIWATFDRDTLESGLVDALPNLEGTEFGTVSAPYGDQNISVTAMVRLPMDSGQEERPLFFMPQPSVEGHLPGKWEEATDAVCLIEKTLDPARSVIWAISGDRHETGWPFQIGDFPDDASPRGWHRLRVAQDLVSLSTPHVYEIYADSIPLDRPLEAKPASHHFYGGPVEFFIGGMPASHGGMIGLIGEIASLEFDPNASCSNCAG